MPFDSSLQRDSVTIPHFTLESGGSLRDVHIAYTTYGTMNRSRSNVILAAHTLTGNAAVHRWWKNIVGTGKALDPKDYYIICANCIGSCYGSTGPGSINADTGEAYGRSFPSVTIRDIARSIVHLLYSLGIESVTLAIGGSFGAMVVSECALLAPDKIKRLVSISCGAEHTAWRVAFSSTIRRIIDYGIETASVDEAFALARRVAMISYRSADEFNERFGRTLRGDTFEIERYLHHHGTKIVRRFSPYSYLVLTQAMERFSLVEGRSCSRSEILGSIHQPTLIIGASSDLLYPESELRALADALPNATYKTLDAPWGHDSFLIEEKQMNAYISTFIQLTTQTIL